MQKKLGRTDKNRTPLPSIDLVVQGSRWFNPRTKNLYTIESIDGDYVNLVPVNGGRRSRKYKPHVIHDLIPAK